MVQKKYTVAVLGAAGGIGQPLSLLLKNNENVGKLNLFDVVPVVAGVAADLSHIETGAKVEGFVGSMKDPKEQKTKLLKALDGVEVAVIPAGVPRKPGMTRDDLFKINAGIVSGLIEGIAEACPKCMICIISNPVNSTVPIAAEVLKKKGVYDPKRLFGVSTLDIVRSNTFIAEALRVHPSKLDVPVVGGHSGVTILPLISQLKTGLSDETIEKLTTRIQNAGTEVVEAKAGAGSATLSMAYAGARFVISLMKAMSGAEGIKECAYVPSSIVPDLDFFASPITLGAEGAAQVHDIGSLSTFEKAQLENKVYPELKKDIDKGVAFATK